MVNIEVTSRIPAIFEITTHELNTVQSLQENVYFYKRDVLMSLEDCSVKATYVIDGTLIAEDIAQEVVGNSYVDFDLTSSEHVQLIPGEMLVEFNIIDNETGANLCPATALIVLVKSSIKDDARITDNSYGTTAEILREVALARGNFNTLGDRLNDVDSDIAALDYSKLPFTVLPTSSTYSESVFSNNQATGTIYAVYMAGTAYWFFNAKVGQDITLQYRFSKNGIEIKGGSMTEWMNIGGKGGEIVTARKTFATLGHRLNSIDSDIATLDNSKLPFTVLPTSSTYSESVFSNNQATGTVYAVNMNGTSYWFFNVKIGADVSIQYRFSKNGIEIKGGSMTEWLNIGGNGGEVVNARGTFANLAARLANMTTNIDTKITYAQATGTLSTAFDNNLALKTVYHVGINPNQYHFVNLDDSTQLRYNANLGFQLREKVNDTWGEWAPAIADGSITTDMLDSVLQGKIVLASHAMQYKFLGNTQSYSVFDENTDPKYIYCVGMSGTYYDFINLSSGVQCKISKFGLEVRTKTNDTWGDWTYLVKNDDRSKLLTMWNDFDSKTYMDVNILGVKTSDTEFDSADYTVPNTKFVFDAVGSLATLFNVPGGTTCELVCDGSRQIVQPVTKDYKYIRYVTSTDPFTADSWIVVGADKTRFVDLGTDSSGTVFSGNRDLDTIYQVYYQGVNYKFLNISANLQMRFSNWPRTIEVKNYSDQTPVWKNVGGAPGEIADARGTFNSLKLRLDDSDSTLSGKLDYVNVSEDPFTTAADFKDYDFQSDKCYQVFLYAGILGTYEPAQVALVFESDWQTRIILGAKSGVFYSTYDSQSEEWNDPVSSLNQATQRQLNDFEQRISALEGNQ